MMLPSTSVCGSPAPVGGRTALDDGQAAADGHAVGVTVVKEAVAEWKRQHREPLIPLTYRPGELAQVDFLDVVVDVAGTRRKAWLFLLRLMYSGRDFGWIYDRQDQISFLDGHVRAFAHLGGVPARLAYDNLKPAVANNLEWSARQGSTTRRIGGKTQRAFAERSEW